MKIKIYYKLIHLLLILLGSLAIFLAYHSSKNAYQKQEDTLNKQVENTKSHLIKTLEMNQNHLSQYLNEISPETIGSKHIFPSQSFSNVSVRLNDGTVHNLYGNSTYTPKLIQAQQQQLLQQKPVVLYHKTNDEIEIYLLKELTNNDGYIIAKLNLDNLLTHGKDAYKSKMYIYKDEVFITDDKQSYDANTLAEIARKRSRFQNAFVNLKHKDSKIYFTKMNMMEHYAINDWTILSADHQLPFYAFVNNSLHSILLFVCLLAIFSLSYLKSHLSRYIQKLDFKINTTKLHNGFNSHLESISLLDKAILSGVKFDDVIDIALKHLTQVLPSHTVGIVKLADDKEGQDTTYLMDSHLKKYSLYAKVDKSLIKKLHANLDGLMVNDFSDSPYFKSLFDCKDKKIQAFPLFKQGSIYGFIFVSTQNSIHITPFHLNCLKNIAQHLGVAITSISHAERLHVKEYFDPVTDLYNQTACRERLSQEISSARRRKTKLAVFHVSLHGYKKVNETFGYLMGDHLLKEAAVRFKSNLRDTDIIARLGADDFVIITSDIDKITHANRLADKIASFFNTPIQVFDNTFSLSTATGISIYPEDGMTADELLNHANIAMLKAKQAGPGQFAFYEDNLSVNELWRISLEKSLREALSNQDLFMMYQPQYNARTKKMTGVEALIRWQHPERGLIKPNDFIQLAEETGLITQIGQYTRNKAFSQFVEWQKMGLPLKTISVNVSSYEMQRMEFLPELKALIEDVGINPVHIELEITESLILEISNNVIENLKSLKALGIKIAIDDFGTGYSNLSYLGRLPFDVLKIDKSFMHGIGMQSNANQIVTMMIEMAHHLEKTVCAEGVETSTQYDFLQNAGCDTIQGFFMSEPLTHEALVALHQDQLIEKALVNA